jgi:hypothetical protein
VSLSLLRFWDRIRPMPKTIFISCGQYTLAEKQLGKQISEMVRTLTDCVRFITILHPRGEIRRPNGSVVRASVWIEQENRRR